MIQIVLRFQDLIFDIKMTRKEAEFLTDEDDIFVIGNRAAYENMLLDSFIFSTAPSNN